MPDTASTCQHTINSLTYCQGTPVTPGIKRRAYVIPTSLILAWPTLTLDSLGRPTSAAYTGNFTLAENAQFKYFDHLPNKAEFKSESQGEEPSKTFKVTATIVHPAVDAAAAAATAALNNTRVVAIVEDMEGRYRVIGCERYDGAVVTSSRDNGQGATGTAGTTITFEADDIVDAPFYTGTIPTADGTINSTAG